MNAEYKDFIAVYKDVYPEGYCQHLISEFERLTQEGAGHNRQQEMYAHKHEKNDMQLGLNFGLYTVGPFNNRSSTSVFFEGVQRCYNHYTEQFSPLREGKIIATHMKMQRTDPGGGYHIWHGEQGNGFDANRVLVYMLYLNTLTPEEAGETEFLYQQRRIRPEENTLIIWPAAFTHTHRGNTVFGERSKYIVTGWFFYD